MNDKASGSPERQLATFLAKYTPKIVAQTEAVLAKMRARLPGAVEMVYDNYNAPVRALMAEAIARSARPFDETRPNKIVIRSVSAKQRPRRPAGR